MILLLLTLATAPAPPTVADQRNARRDACAKLHAEPETPASRASFKACVAQIRYDGDLPLRPTKP